MVQLQFSRNTPKYAGAPVEEYKAMNQAVQERHDKAIADMTGLEILANEHLSTVRDYDKPVVQDAIGKIAQDFESIKKTGRYQDANKLIMQTAKNFKMNNHVKEAQMNKQREQAHLQDLKERYEKDDITYQDYQTAVALSTRMNNRAIEYDPETGIAKNQYSGYNPADYYDFTDKFDKFVGDLKANKTPITFKDADGKEVIMAAVPGKDGFVDMNGTQMSVTDARFRNMAAHLIAQDPNADAYLNDQAKMAYLQEAYHLGEDGTFLRNENGEMVKKDDSPTEKEFIKNYRDNEIQKRLDFAGSFAYNQSTYNFSNNQAALNEAKANLNKYFSVISTPGVIQNADNGTFINETIDVLKNREKELLEAQETNDTKSIRDELVQVRTRMAVANETRELIEKQWVGNNPHREGLLWASKLSKERYYYLIDNPTKRTPEEERLLKSIEGSYEGKPMYTDWGTIYLSTVNEMKQFTKENPLQTNVEIIQLTGDDAKKITGELTEKILNSPGEFLMPSSISLEQFLKDKGINRTEWDINIEPTMAPLTSGVTYGFSAVHKKGEKDPVKSYVVQPEDPAGYALQLADNIIKASKAANNPQGVLAGKKMKVHTKYAPAFHQVQLDEANGLNLENTTKQIEITKGNIGELSKVPKLHENTTLPIMKDGKPIMQYQFVLKGIKYTGLSLSDLYYDFDYRND